MAIRAVILVLFIFFSAYGADKSGKWRKFWRWSASTLIFSTAADIGSSLGGGVENNPLFAGANGAFRPGKATATKFGLTSGLLIVEYWIMKKYPEETPVKILALGNFAISGANCWVAGRNFTRPASARITPAIPMSP